MSCPELGCGLASLNSGVLTSELTDVAMFMYVPLLGDTGHSLSSPAV